VPFFGKDSRHLVGSLLCVIRGTFVRKTSNLQQQGALVTKLFQMCEIIQESCRLSYLPAIHPPRQAGVADTLGLGPPRAAGFISRKGEKYIHATCVIEIRQAPLCTLLSVHLERMGIESELFIL